MDLFELNGKVVVELADAVKAFNEINKEGENSQSKLSKAFSAIGKGALAVGKTIATGLAAGATAMGALTVKALNLSGELEQNMGGSEAVFGKYAENMQDTAKEAFSNMGLSTSDYLQTANKMGALFQGAGFSVKESMTISQDAMQRAADVASIMGIDTESAMEAIAGAAKGNFTMMDNLGVAMNDTAIQNYALSKGIKKATKDMTQQEKIGLAMEMFMEKTAYAAGNYAKENETLAGSLGTAKAALTNFLDGSGDVDQLVTAFKNAADVIVKNIKDIAPRLIEGVIEIVNKVVPMLPGLIADLLPVILDGALALIQGIINALPGLIQMIVDVLPQLISSIVTIANTIIELLPDIIASICAALPTLIPQLIDGIMSMITTLLNNIMDIIQPIIDCLPDVIISIVEALVRNLPALIDGIINLVMGIVEAIPDIIQGLVDAIPTIISLLIESLLKNLPKIIAGLVKVVWGIVKSLPQIFMSLIEGIVNIFVGIWDGVKNVFSDSKVGDFFSKVWQSIKKAFSSAVNWFKDIFTKAWNGIKNAWAGVKNFFSNLWNGIKNIFSGVGNWFKDKFNNAKNNAQNAWSGVKNFFGNIWGGIKNAFSNVGGWFKDKFTSAKNGITNAWSSVGNWFTNVKNKITGAFSNIKDKISAPFIKARDFIKGIVDKIKGFFNFKINLPKIKLPHFRVEPSGWKFGDLLKGSIPKLKIDWYAKGGILNEPTLFDYNPMTGRAKVGGEAGAEAVAPIETLQQYIKAAVQSENAMMASRLDRIIDLLVQFFPDALGAMNQTMVLDTGVLVAHTATQMDRELGKLAIKKGRGR